MLSVAVETSDLPNVAGKDDGRSPHGFRRSIATFRCLGEFRGLDYLAAARTGDGSTVIAYLPSARTFTVEMNKIAGKTAKAWWFDPRTGKSNLAGEFPASGQRQFTPPGEGDWVLILDDASRNLPGPGKR